MSAPPVLLLFGAGPNLGAGIAAAFSKAGYKVALASRSTRKEFDNNGYYHVQADFGEPEAIRNVFDRVHRDVGVPTVVVYNAVQYSTDDPTDPLATLAPESISQFNTTLAVNGTSPLVALHHAIASFRCLPSGTKGKAFIFTGNLLNHSQVRNRFCFGIGKSVSAYGIRIASETYTGEGFRFYYADERTTSGHPVMREIDGASAGTVYLQLAETPQQLPWLYTYVKGGDYKDFGEKHYLKTIEGNRKGGRI